MGNKGRTTHRVSGIVTPVIGEIGPKVPTFVGTLVTAHGARYGRVVAGIHTASAGRSGARRGVLGFLATAVAVLILSACGDDGAAPLAGVVREPPLSVANVELLDVAAAEPAPRAMKADADELLLVYFGYTTCPDICPTTMSDISVAVNDLPDELADRVTMSMVTVDPERDTPDVLAGYLEHFFDSSIPLQADGPEALADAADAFGVRYEVADHEPGDLGYDVSHSAVTYVIDDTGTVVVEWPFGFEIENMTADIKALLDR